MTILNKYPWCEEFKELMRKQGMNTRLLAERAGVCEDSVKRVLRGGWRTRMTTVRLIAHALNREIHLLNHEGRLANIKTTIHRSPLREEDIAKKAGVSMASVSKILTDPEHISASVLCALAATLRLRVVVLPRKANTYYTEPIALCGRYTDTDSCIAYLQGWDDCLSQMRSKLTEWISEELTKDNLIGCRDYEELIQSLNDTLRT